MTSTPTHHPLLRLLTAGTLVAGLTLGAVACGDDDGDAVSSSGSALPGVDAGSAAGDSDSDDADVDNGFGPEACDALVAFHGALASAPEDPAEAPAFGAELVGIVGDLRSALPAPLAPDGDTLLAGAEAVATDGDPGALFSSEVIQAQTNIGWYAHDDCEAEKVDVTAADFSFDGLPDELPAGRVSMKLFNEGTEEHELVLLRRNDDSTAELEDLADDPETLFAEATFTGVAYADSGDSAYAVLDLEPGTYFVVCTIPTGGDESGEPHTAHGMYQTVEVA